MHPLTSPQVFSNLNAPVSNDLLPGSLLAMDATTSVREMLIQWVWKSPLLLQHSRFQNKIWIQRSFRKGKTHTQHIGLYYVILVCVWTKLCDPRGSTCSMNTEWEGRESICKHFGFSKGVAPRGTKSDSLSVGASKALQGEPALWVQTQASDREVQSFSILKPDFCSRAPKQTSGDYLYLNFSP